MRIFSKRIFSLFAGKPAFQRFLVFLQRLALVGMGIGSGADCDTSGELQVLRYAKGRLMGAPIIFDVGAHIGNYTKLVQQTFLGAATVHAFEPSNETYNRLQHNLTGAENVLLHNAALGDQPGTSELYSEAPASRLGSLYHRRLDHFGRELSQRESVRVDTIDDFCRRNRIKCIDFLKLDVEGNELKCLKGATRMVTENRVRFIQFEFGGADIDSRTFFQDFWYLLSPKYRLYRILPGGLYEVDRYTEELEVFLTTNYLAELK